eukprot:366554-Chlamydomonas_euryale.AAC.10
MEAAEAEAEADAEVEAAAAPAASLAVGSSAAAIAGAAAERPDTSTCGGQESSARVGLLSSAVVDAKDCAAFAPAHVLLLLHAAAAAAAGDAAAAAGASGGDSRRSSAQERAPPRGGGEQNTAWPLPRCRKERGPAQIAPHPAPPAHGNNAAPSPPPPRLCPNKRTKTYLHWCRRMHPELVSERAHALRCGAPRLSARAADGCLAHRRVGRC